MKKLLKFSALAAILVTLGTAGVAKASAGTVIITRGAPYCATPVYRVYPRAVYVAPVCLAAPVIAPVCVVPAPVVYPYYRPAVRVGVLFDRHPILRRR